MMNNRKQVVRRKISIRRRLLQSFILVALLPTIAISASSVIFSFLDARTNSGKQLDSILTLKETEIEAWIEDSKNELTMTLSETYLLERIQVVLKFQTYQSELEYYDYYKEGARYRLNRYLNDTQLLIKIFFLDPEGDVVLSTDQEQEGENLQSKDYFNLAYGNSNAQIFIEKTDDGSGISILFTYPVLDQDGLVVGEMVTEMIPEKLFNTLNTSPLFESEVQAYLFSVYSQESESVSDPVILSETGLIKEISNPGFVSKMGMDDVTNSFSSYRNFDGDSVFGVYKIIPELGFSVLVEQGFSSVIGNILSNQVVNIVIVIAGIILAVIISILTSTRIANPLAHLAEASVEIASGDFSRVVKVEEEDEIGVLANAFNSMSNQLRNLINDLESRVQERTEALQQSNSMLMKRARQMETTSQVSREITSILNIDHLLNSIVSLIQDAFSYHQVSIYLLDRETNHLVQRVGSDSVDHKNMMIELNEKSLNGKAAINNQAIMVNDVTLEPDFQLDKNFPETQSELVIPLRIGRNVIGTVDIQNTEKDSFTQDDLQVLQGLADQIAIAINNALLYERNQVLAIMEERNRMARELHDSISQLLYSQVMYADASGTYLAQNQPEKASGYVNQLKESAYQAIKEMRLMIYELRPSILENEGFWGAINHRLETVEKQSNITVQLVGDQDLQIPSNIEKDLYMITQEALNNVLRHSQAASVIVALEQHQENIQLSIFDDGTGFDMDNVKAGQGLNNIKIRVENIGGSLNIESAKGEGTKIIINIAGGNSDNKND